MADAVTDPKAPGWKRDPSGKFAGRYWDGAAWTEHVVGQDRVRSTDPLPAKALPPAQPTAAADRTEAARPAVVPPAAASLPRSRPPAAPAAAIVARWRVWPLWARVALPVVLVVALVTVLTQGGNDTGDTGDTTSDPPARTYSLGATARSAEFDVTVFGFKDPQPPGQFLKPSPGTHYVSVDVQLANRGSTQQNFSSLLQIHLVDDSNRQYDPTFGEVTPPAPDGEIPSGQAIRGNSLFEVSDGTTGLRVRVQGSLTAAGVYFSLA